MLVQGRMRAFLLPAALLLAGFDFVPPHKELARPDPVFRAEEFFLGRTQSSGKAKQAFSRAKTLAVQSVGHAEPDGTLVLDQVVHRQDNPPERRQWRIRRLPGGRYSGTITDAKGPVTGEVRGNCLHLRYTVARGGLSVDQYLYLQPGGRTAANRMTFRKLGITFATVEEVIRRVD